MNKKGNIFLVAGFLLFMLIIIFFVFAITIGTGIVTYTTEELDGALSDLGMVGSTNLTDTADITFGTLNTSVQMLSWFSGIVAVLMLVSILIFAAAIRTKADGFLMGMYLFMVVLLIFVSIFLSNFYEGIYTKTDVVASELQSMVMASFLVLHLPQILTVIAFIGGIIIFTGMGEEGFV